MFDSGYHEDFVRCSRGVHSFLVCVSKTDWLFPFISWVLGDYIREITMAFWFASFVISLSRRLVMERNGI